MHFLGLHARQSALGTGQAPAQLPGLAYLDMYGAPHSLSPRAAVLVAAAQLPGQASLASTCGACCVVSTELLTSTAG